jgi:NADPH-dependent 2,4-dienoyl-CoA reductase/sulfur reductase-like enzyme
VAIERFSADVVVAGAGPAGLAAAWAARRCGRGVTVVDGNAAPGGQIWRNEMATPSTARATLWMERFRGCGARLIADAAVIDAPEPRRLLVSGPEAGFEIEFRSLVLATGARELFLPFPGWTLPGVFGAGGLQALVKDGLRVAGKRVAVAGSGPLLAAVAAYLAQSGAEVLCVAEQAPIARLARFAMALLGRPAKLAQAVQLFVRSAGAPLLASAWPLAAHGEGRVESVTLRSSGRTLRLACDYLACGFGLAPNTELAALLGCALEEGRVVVDASQRTSVEGVYCAGEPGGIGGLDAALVEGQIAGYCAAGRPDLAAGLSAERRRADDFRRELARAFRLRDELKALAAGETIVCRCEDVTLARLEGASSWREAKLHTRCGMGPCQGRVCGPAVEFLFGWRPDSVRPPLYPAAVETLAGD